MSRDIVYFKITNDRKYGSENERRETTSKDGQKGIHDFLRSSVSRCP